MTEIFRKIDDVYSISSEGRFFYRGTEIRGGIDDGGYRKVPMYGKRFRLARLVAFAFPEICGKHFKGAEADHINTIRYDDRAENIRWVSHKMNQNNPLTKKHLSDAKREKSEYKRPETIDYNAPWYNKHHTEETKKKMSEAAHNKKPIIQYSKKGKFIREFGSVREAARVLNLYVGSIRDCCKGRQKSAYGFLWRYKDNNTCENNG